MKKIKKSILISSLAAVAAVSGVAVAITYPNKSTKLPPVAMEDDNIPVLGDSPCYDITTNPIQRTLYTNAQDTGKYYFNDNNPDAGQGNYRSINQIYFSRTSLTFGYSIAEESDLTDYIEDHAAADGYVPLIDVYKQKLVNNVLLAMRDENASIASLQWKKIRYYEGGTGADSNLYSPTNDIENGTMLSKNTSLLSITGATINDTDHEVVWDNGTISLKYAMDDSNDSIMSHLYVTRDSKLHTFVIMFKGNFNFNISISIPQGTNDTDDQPYPNKISYDSFVEGVETDPNSANYGTPKGDAISLQDTPISATPITMNNSIGIIKWGDGLANDYYNLSPDAQELAHINFGLKFFDIMGNEITDASIIKQLWLKELNVRVASYENYDYTKEVSSTSAGGYHGTPPTEITPNISINKNTPAGSTKYVSFSVPVWEWRGYYEDTSSSNYVNWTLNSRRFDIEIIDKLLGNQIIYKFSFNVHRQNA